MAKKKYSFGSLLVFGAATAALAGVAAYKHHNELKKVVEDIAEELDARDVDGVFEADLLEDLGEDDKIVHIVPNAKADEPEGDEEDFVDGGEKPAESENPEEPDPEE